MKLNILIGWEAGQGINKVSEIVSKILVDFGYFTFNYRDYPSLVRGGHNFNILSLSDKRVGSSETQLDGIVAMDEKTVTLHRDKLKKDSFIITSKSFENLGRNLNVALAGGLIKTLGIDEKILTSRVEQELKNQDSVDAAKKGYDAFKTKFDLKKLDNKIKISSGSTGVAMGAIDSKIDRYIAYPMTPATGVMVEIAKHEKNNGLVVFQPESEIATINIALGASFTGAKTMVGTSGGGFDLMAEGLSLQGMSEIPLVVYLAARSGPGTGMATYTAQADLEDALRAGHGEFPRVVSAPGDPIEASERTNEAFYLSQKFGCLAIVLSDKHLAESEFSSDREPNKTLAVEILRKLPGSAIVKASSMEHDKDCNTTDDPEIAKKNADARVKRYQEIKKAIEKFEMVKLFGDKDSRNLVIGWGSTKCAILDAIEGEDIRFLQVNYLKPMSNQIKEEILKSDKVILVENNLTGQLGRLIRGKTGIKIKDRILKYDGRPFFSDQLRKKIKEII